jgi:hypothetical protein
MACLKGFRTATQDAAARFEHQSQSLVLGPPPRRIAALAETTEQGSSAGSTSLSSPPLHPVIRTNDFSLN